MGNRGASLEGGDEPVRDPLRGALHPRGLIRFAMSRQQDSPSLAEQGIVLSPVKLRVLARPAPKRGLGVARVPPQRAANLTGPARDADGMAGRDEGTGALVEPRNMDQKASCPCREDHEPDTITCPMVGETEDALHTENLTLPSTPYATLAA